MTKTKKLRLDVLLTERGLVESRTQAKPLIMAGKVRVDGQVMTKAGMPIATTAEVSVEAASPYVGRGGYKLAAALSAFEVAVTGRVCADVGASTGGFTDVLLQHGAAKIYAIDVGYGQLAWKIRQDERVEVMERTNARYLTELPETVSLVSIDVSFISLKLIFPVVARWLPPAGEVLALVKPQFEAGKEKVGKKGVVRDPAVHEAVLKQVNQHATNSGLTMRGVIPSPITGATGNQEFVMWLSKAEQANIDMTAAIKSCLASLNREA